MTLPANTASAPSQDTSEKLEALQDSTSCSTPHSEPAITIAKEEYGEHYTNYQLNRSWLRRTIRKAYIYNIARRFQGPVLDVGCGIGELLSALPKGSRGLEINPVTVEYCQQRNLAVDFYDPDADAYSLQDYNSHPFDGLVMSHVLEHLENPEFVLRSLIKSAKRMGMRSVVAVVPGYKGFQSDETHRVFVTREMFQRIAQDEATECTLANLSYFPFNSFLVGTLFTHNELVAEFTLR